MKRSVFIFAFFILFPNLSFGEMYKWKDENGKTHFTDSPAKIPLKYRNKGIKKIKPMAPAINEEDNGERKRQGRIKTYKDREKELENKITLKNKDYDDKKNLLTVDSINKRMERLESSIASNQKEVVDYKATLKRYEKRRSEAEIGSYSEDPSKKYIAEYKKKIKELQILINNQRNQMRQLKQERNRL